MSSLEMLQANEDNINLRGLDTLCRFCAILYMGDTTCGFLFAHRIPPEKGSALKGNNLLTKYFLMEALVKVFLIRREAKTICRFYAIL